VVITAETVEQTLRDHAFQPVQAPGLYPEQDTICSCSQSPASEPPDGDYAWWAWHVSLIAAGRTPAGYQKEANGDWTQVPGEERR